VHKAFERCSKHCHLSQAESSADQFVFEYLVNIFSSCVFEDTGRRGAVPFFAKVLEAIYEPSVALYKEPVK